MFACYYSAMKTKIMIIVVASAIFSCAQTLQTNTQTIIIEQGSEAVLNEDNTYRFTPAENASAELLGKTVTLSGGFESVISEEGKLLFGKLADDCSFKNDYAEIHIPAGSEFAYYPEYKDYMFSHQEGIESELKLGDVTLPYYVYAIVFESGHITTTVRQTSQFSLNSKEYIFYENDPIFIDAEKGPRLDFKGVDNRNDYIRSVINERNFAGHKHLNELFFHGDNYGSRVFMGSPVFAKLNPAEVELKISKVENDSEQLRQTLRDVKQAPHYKSSFKFILSIPVEGMTIAGFQKGFIYAFIHEAEVDEIKYAIDQKEPVYVIMPMALFNDFNSTGTGVIIASMGEKEYLD